MADCIFCKIANKEIPADKYFHEDENLAVIPDKFPKAQVHLLIIPKKHIESVVTAEEADSELIGKLVMAAAKVAKQQGITDYQLVFNTGKHLQVPHLHLHLISGPKNPLPV